MCRHIFLKLQKYQTIRLQDHLERYCKVLPVFGFISAKYDIKLTKSYLLSLLVKERKVEQTVIKKANQFVSFKFGDIQLLEISNFLGGTTSRDSFSKAYKTSETKWYFPYEWLTDPENLNNTELLPYETLFSKLRNKKLFETDYSDFQCLIDGGLTSTEASSKLKLKQPPATGPEHHQYMTSVLQQENMCTFKDFLV